MKDPLKIWEYLYISLTDLTRHSPNPVPASPKSVTEALNELGAQGWELCAISGSPTPHQLYFKREKQNG